MPALSAIAENRLGKRKSSVFEQSMQNRFTGAVDVSDTHHDSSREQGLERFKHLFRGLLFEIDVPVGIRKASVSLGLCDIARAFAGGNDDSIRNLREKSRTNCFVLSTLSGRQFISMMGFADCSGRSLQTMFQMSSEEEGSFAAKAFTMQQSPFGRLIS